MMTRPFPKKKIKKWPKKNYERKLYWQKNSINYDKKNLRSFNDKSFWGTNIWVIFLESIVWSSLNNSKGNSKNKYFISFLMIVFILIITSLLFPTHQHEYEKKILTKILTCVFSCPWNLYWIKLNLTLI
jgi:hypothetical protein